MGQRPRATGTWTAAILVGSCAITAPAQGVGVNYRRPTENAPSILGTHVGGFYTGNYSYQPVRPIATQRDVSAGATQFNLGFGFGRLPSNEDNSIPAPMRLGTVAYPRARSLLRDGELSDSAIREISGFAGSIRYDTPIGGWGQTDVPPLPPLGLIDRRPPGDRFQQFFRLTPVPEPLPPDAKPCRYVDLAAAVEETTRARIRQDREEGLTLFRSLMGGNFSEAQDRVEKLRRTIRLLSNVRDLNAEDPVPCLLLTHAYLDRGQLSTALNALIAAAHRRPEEFRDGSKLAAYFGDVDPRSGRSEALERQVRSYLGRAGVGPTVDGYVLEAYWAWVLADKTRSRQALDKAEALLAEGKVGSPNVGELIAALRYAM